MSSPIKKVFTLILAATLPLFLLGKTKPSIKSKLSSISNTTDNNLVEIQKQDSTLIYKIQALKYAKNQNAKEACIAIEKYIQKTADLSFLKQREFNYINSSNEYKELASIYLPKTNGWVLFFLFSSIIGIFIALILNLKSDSDKKSNLLLSLYIFFHSLLITQINMGFSNLSYLFPHYHNIAIAFSFLYGPLLYYYFRRSTNNYKFKIQDLLHLIPTIALIIYIFPFFILSANEKTLLLINQEKLPLFRRDIIILLKITSLITYNYLIYKLYLKKKNKKNNSEKTIAFNSWQNKIIVLNTIYIVSYIIYVLPLLENTAFFNFLNFDYAPYLLTASMSSIVLYVALIAYTDPFIFKAKSPIKAENNNQENLNKYKKSGLTTDLSFELKNNLIQLLHEDKIFKQNNLTLDLLAKKLETTRHNTSQIINEHFDMNFFELINQHRIKEAKRILEQDKFRNMNIIDIAYEVGYNNKVTFNKAFKKETSLTPTQYQEFYKNLTESNINLNDSKSNLFSGSGKK